MTRVGEHTADEDYDLLRSTPDRLAGGDHSGLSRRDPDGSGAKSCDCCDSRRGMALHGVVDL